MVDHVNVHDDNGAQNWKLNGINHVDLIVVMEHVLKEA